MCDVDVAIDVVPVAFDVVVVVVVAGGAAGGGGGLGRPQPSLLDQKSPQSCFGFPHQFGNGGDCTEILPPKSL